MQGNKAHQIKDAARKILGSSCEFNQKNERIELYISKSKPLVDIANNITALAVNDSKRVSPPKMQSTMLIHPDAFDGYINKNVFHQKVSSFNSN